MGMYDTFVMEDVVKCPKCGNPIGPEFQSKQVRNSLNVYVQGKPAVEWKYRTETPEEKKIKLDEFKVEHPEWFDTETGEILERFKIMELTGCMIRTDEVASVIGDGEYTAYDICKECDKMVYVDMVVYKGIFLGIRGYDDGKLDRLFARFKRIKSAVKKIKQGPPIRIDNDED